LGGLYGQVHITRIRVGELRIDRARRWGVYIQPSTAHGRAQFTIDEVEQLFHLAAR
jgi:hypothetical protein